MTNQNIPQDPPPPPPSPRSRNGNGKLTAAGVLQHIQGGLFGIGGLYLFSASQSGIGELADDLTGGALTFIALLLIGIAIALIWIAVLCIKGRKGGWVTTVVFQSIFVVLSVIGLLGALSEGNADGGGLVVTAYCGVALFLAVKGGKELSQPSQQM